MTVYQHPVDPATYDASDPFGNVRATTGRPHLGSDYAVAEGTPVRCISDGQVVAVAWSDVLGWVVGVYHWDGFFLGYAHLSSTVAQVGQLVPRGTDLAYSGGTGSASRGDHLHISCGTTPGAIWGEGFGSTLVDPFARIESLLLRPSSDPATLIALLKGSTDMPLLIDNVDPKTQKPTGGAHLLDSQGRATFYSVDSPEYVRLRNLLSGLGLHTSAYPFVIDTVRRQFGDLSRKSPLGPIKAAVSAVAAKFSRTESPDPLANPAALAASVIDLPS